jgi:Tol biopolymer transport system component
MKRLIVLAVLALTALAGAVHTAHANFPGADGRIAYSKGSTGEIWTVEPDGSAPKLVASPSNPGHTFDSEPAWSPNGQQIVFTEFGDDNTDRLWLVNADGTNRHLLFTESPLYNDFQGNWSPDGSRVIFRRCNDGNANTKEQCTIYAVKVDGHGLTQITQTSQNVKQNNFDVKPEFSPDGRTISFSSFNRGGVQNGIYLMKSHGGSIQLITPTGLGATDADWSPDGSKMVFWTHCCDAETSTIDAMNADGSGITTLTSPGTSHDLRPNYAPQGDRVVFERDAPDFSTSDIETIPAGGGTPTVVATDAGSPNWGTAP